MNKANLVIKGNLVCKNIITTSDLLQDCKVWATLTTGDNKTYIGSTYTHN